MLTFPKRGALRYPWCTRYPERKIYIQVPQDTYGDIHQNQEKLENRGSKNPFPSLLKFDISQILSKCNFYSSLSFKVHFLINLLSYWQVVFLRRRRGVWKNFGLFLLFFKKKFRKVLSQREYFYFSKKNIFYLDISLFFVIKLAEKLNSSSQNRVNSS